MVAVHKRSRKKKLFLALLVIVLVAAGGFLYHQHHKPVHTYPVPKGTTSKPTVHQVTTQNNSTGQGGVVDKNGQAAGALPPASKWTSSDSGTIILQLPSAGTTIKSGDSLVGLAKVDNVQFILKDDTVGLIAQGNLKVVDGKFSGVLQFTPHAGTGKLEIYYPDPQNGAEKDIIDIDVSFSP
jgi:hypothetical protein